LGLKSTRLPALVREQGRRELCTAAPEPRRAHIRCGNGTLNWSTGQEHAGTPRIQARSRIVVGCKADFIVGLLTQQLVHPAMSPAGDQTGHIRVWDLTASACSCELVPEIGTPVRSLTVALDGTMIVAANNNGTCYVWRMMRGKWMLLAFLRTHVCACVLSACMPTEVVGE